MSYTNDILNVQSIIQDETKRIYNEHTNKPAQLKFIHTVSSDLLFKLDRFVDNEIMDYADSFRLKVENIGLEHPTDPFNTMLHLNSMSNTLENIYSLLEDE